MFYIPGWNFLIAVKFGLLGHVEAIFTVTAHQYLKYTLTKSDDFVRFKLSFRENVAHPQMAVISALEFSVTAKSHQGELVPSNRYRKRSNLGKKAR